MYEMRVNDIVTVNGWNGTYKITAINRAANEVRVAPLSTWVSADRVTVVGGEPDPIHLVVGAPNDAWISCDPVGDCTNPPLTQRSRDRAKATCPDCLADEPLLDDPHYEAEMNLRAMQDDRAATERDPDCGCTSSNGDKYCELHGETPGY
jgi:hypothetical protein